MLKTVKRTVSFEIEFIADVEDGPEDIENAIWESLTRVLEDETEKRETKAETYPDCEWTAHGIKSFDSDSLRVIVAM